MAQVKSAIEARVEHFLSYLTREWNRVPEYAAAFSSWDETRQLAFVHEWDVKESGLRILDEASRRGEMTADQCRRYDALRVLVAKHRPLVERLRED